MLMPHEAAHLVASRAIPLLQQHSRLGAAVRLLRAALPLLITRPLPPFSRNSVRAEGAAHFVKGFSCCHFSDLQDSARLAPGWIGLGAGSASCL